MTSLERPELLGQQRLPPHLSTSYCGSGSLGMGGNIGADSLWVAGWLLNPLPCLAPPTPSWISVPRKEGRKLLGGPALLQDPGLWRRGVKGGDLGWRTEDSGWGEGKKGQKETGEPKSFAAITLFYSILYREATTCRVTPSLTQSQVLQEVSW